MGTLAASLVVLACATASCSAVTAAEPVSEAGTDTPPDSRIAADSTSPLDASAPADATLDTMQSDAPHDGPVDEVARENGVMDVPANDATAADAFSEASDAGDATSVDASALDPIFTEAIPGSLNRSPDGTWWGYHQSKVVRNGSLVFMYVVENDNDAKTPSIMRIYKKDGTGAWTSGVGFACSRPGNLLLDSSGVLHAFVFEPTTLETNDSIGKLKHYWFPSASTGDITTNLQETIVDNQGTLETVNIRVGAAIGTNDTMAVAFGLYTVASGHTEQLYSKAKSDTSWTKSIAGTNQGHDFFYPFVLVTSSGFNLLPIQDDLVQATNSNLYQMIRHYEQKAGTWSYEDIVDLRTHPQASTKDRLLEQSDLFEDSSGTLHYVYKEILKPNNLYDVSAFKHGTRTKGSSTWTVQSIDLTSVTINWIRLVEVGGRLYFVGTSWFRVYLLKEDGTALTDITPANMNMGPYPYLSTPRGGTKSAETQLDVLLLDSEQLDYPNARNLYMRIPKSRFGAL